MKNTMKVNLFKYNYQLKKKNIISNNAMSMNFFFITHYSHLMPPTTRPTRVHDDPGLDGSL